MECKSDGKMKISSKSEFLKIENLIVNFHNTNQIVRAVKGVDLSLKPETTFGLIGETGCGKSVLGRAIMQLLPRNASVEGKIYYKGHDLVKFNEKKMQKLRGIEIALIPQNPTKSLNPVIKIKTQVVEALQNYLNISKKDGENKTLKIFNRLNLPSPKDLIEKYPHQLSGGMNQRVLAAIGMSGNPSLLIADEPTKGLDAVIRGQVVDLIKELKELTGSSVLLITHDLKVASSLCDEIGVMYEGEIVELTKTDSFFRNPLHPYSKALLGSMPENGFKSMKKLTPEISTTKTLKGCNFYDYCSYSLPKCKYDHPFPVVLTDRIVRCFYSDKSTEFEKIVSSLG